MAADQHTTLRRQLAQVFVSAQSITSETPWDEKRQILDEWFSVLLRTVEGEPEPRVAEDTRAFVMAITGWGEHFVEVYLDARLHVEREKVSGSDSDVPSTATCRLCGGDRWFRLSSQPTWVCARCHPPVVPDVSLEFWPPSDDTTRLVGEEEA